MAIFSLAYEDMTNADVKHWSAGGPEADSTSVAALVLLLDGQPRLKTSIRRIATMHLGWGDDSDPGTATPITGV